MLSDSSLIDTKGSANQVTESVGEFRTKRVILEMYDAMAAAMQGGAPYLTRLDPPPADARVAHEG